MTRCRPSLGGVPRVGSPASSLLWRHSDSSRFVRPCFVAFTQPYLLGAPCSLPARRSAPRAGLGLLLGRCPRPALQEEGAKPPRFLGDPHVHAPLLDPGGTATSGHSGEVPYFLASQCCLPLYGRRRLPREAISGLNHAACTLAVYASRPRLPVCCLRPRKTRSRLVAHLGRAGLEPAGSHREVSACPTTYMASSSPRLGLAHVG
jgi:hypothetical protein